MVSSLPPLQSKGSGPRRTIPCVLPTPTMPPWRPGALACIHEQGAFVAPSQPGPAVVVSGRSGRAASNPACRVLEKNQILRGQTGDRGRAAEAGRTLPRQVYLHASLSYHAAYRHAPFASAPAPLLSAGSSSIRLERRLLLSRDMYTLGGNGSHGHGPTVSRSTAPSLGLPPTWSPPSSRAPVILRCESNSPHSPTARGLASIRGCDSLADQSGAKEASAACSVGRSLTPSETSTAAQREASKLRLSRFGSSEPAYLQQHSSK